MEGVWFTGVRGHFGMPGKDSPEARVVYSLKVKADIADWPKGLTQARVYRNGVHHAFLAVPFSTTGRIHALEQEARDSGIGVLLLDGSRWHEAVPPADPRPLPSKLQATSLALEGVPAARKLLLNHPLNYLVVPYLRLVDGETSLSSLMEQYWPDLQAASSRRYAIEGARVLGLIDMEGHLTPKGATIADLLQGVGFTPDARPAKRLRLAEAAAPVAAVARAVLLDQPAVSLVVDTLRRTRDGSLRMSSLLTAAVLRDQVLARALFLRDPERDLSRALCPVDFRTTTVFQFKQILWHAGILATKAEPGAGGGAANYGLAEDVWGLDERILRRRPTVAS